MYVQSNDIVAYECSLMVNLDNDNKIIVDMNKCWNLRNVPVDVTTIMGNHGVCRIMEKTQHVKP